MKPIKWGRKAKTECKEKQRKQIILHKNNIPRLKGSCEN